MGYFRPLYRVRRDDVLLHDIEGRSKVFSRRAHWRGTCSESDSRWIARPVAPLYSILNILSGMRYLPYPGVKKAGWGIRDQLSGDTWQPCSRLVLSVEYSIVHSQL